MVYKKEIKPLLKVASEVNNDVSTIVKLFLAFIQLRIHAKLSSIDINDLENIFIYQTIANDVDVPLNMYLEDFYQIDLVIQTFKDFCMEANISVFLNFVPYEDYISMDVIHDNEKVVIRDAKKYN